MPKELLGIVRIINNGKTLTIKISVDAFNRMGRYESKMDKMEYVFLDISVCRIMQMVVGNRQMEIATLGGIENGS